MIFFFNFTTAQFTAASTVRKIEDSYYSLLGAAEVLRTIDSIGQESTPLGQRRSNTLMAPWYQPAPALAQIKTLTLGYYYFDTMTMTATKKVLRFALAVSPARMTMTRLKID